MPDFVAIDAGLTFWGDPDAVYDLPPEKRVRTMTYLLARKEKVAAMWSVSPLLASDLVHLLSQVLGKGKGGGSTSGDDLMAGLLASLWEPDGG